MLKRVFLIVSLVIAKIASVHAFSRYISQSLSAASTSTFTLACSPPPILEVPDMTISDFLQVEKKHFLKFYEDNVSCGSSMSLEVFLMNGMIESMLNEKVLTADEVSDVWIELWGCNCKCLTEKEAFETISAIHDLKKVSTG